MTSLMLEVHERKWLKDEAHKRNISFAELIRRMIAYFKATLKANKDLI